MIPPFSQSLVLPPIYGNPAQRSPYRASFTELAQRLATSDHRKQLLRGLRLYRAKLRDIGITGFQWINGSLVENVEELRQDNPKDVDVVTFFRRPPNMRAQ